MTILSNRKHRRAPLLAGVALLACATALQYPVPLSASSGRAEAHNKRMIERAPDRPASRAASEAYGRMALAFEANHGRLHRSVKFMARGRDYMAYLTESGATLKLGRDEEATLGISFAGANRSPRMSSLDELPGRTSYLIGRDPASWKRNIPVFSRVKCREVYPGIDVIYYGNRQELEYDFIVAPRAATRAIRLRFDGASDIKLDAQGDLLLRTATGEVRQRKPVAYQSMRGARREVAAAYVIESGNEVTFRIGDYDSSRPLVIDPVLSYSKRIGGGNVEEAFAVAADRSGNSYITGHTASADLPVAGPDIFVVKLNAEGEIIYSTVVGGAANDMGFDIAVDKAGNAYVTGATSSRNFPVTPGAFQTSHSGGSLGILTEEALVFKLNASGNALVYSTYLGGSGRQDSNFAEDRGMAIAVDPSGSAYVAGITFSTTFPTRKALQPRFNMDRPGTGPSCFTAAPLSFPISDGFITKLNRAGSALAFSTYFGGTGSEEVRDIALDLSGNIYVAGRTCSGDFPRVNAAQTIYGGGPSDAFVSKLAPSGRGIIFSTLFGGDEADIASGVAVDSGGNVVIAGETNSSNLSTTAGVIQPRLGGSVFFRAINEGEIGEARKNGLRNDSVNVIAVNPVDPSTIYINVDGFSPAEGIFKSTDFGATWNKSGPAGAFLRFLALDRQNPETIYGSSFNGLSRSTDGGNTWRPLNAPGQPALFTRVFAIDPFDSATLYAANGGPEGDTLIEVRLFKSTDGGSSWSRLNNGLPGFFEVTGIQVDPTNSSTVYTTGLLDQSGIYKSTDGGASWNRTGHPRTFVTALAIDPAHPSILYAGSLSGVRKSTDGGQTFGEAGLSRITIGALAIDPARPLTVYAGTGSTFLGGGGVFRSTDGGDTWDVTDLKGMPVLALAIDPVTPSNLYAGAVQDTDAFIARYSPTGGPPLFATYLGHWGSDRAFGAEIDAAGNIYAAGDTLSFKFPVVDALQSVKSSPPFQRIAFITRLDATGDRIRYSTLFGDHEAVGARGLAVDAAGKVYIAGPTHSDALSGEVGGEPDIFAARISAPPVISAISIRGNKLFVHGEGFDTGAVILIDGTAVATKNESANMATILLTKQALALLPPGRSVNIRVRNPDGLESAIFTFVRP